MISEKGAIKFIVIGAIALLSLIGLYLVLFRQTQTELSEIKGTGEKQAFNAKSVPNKSSKKIAFIRDGDLWISSAEGKNQKQLTTHKPISYTFRHIYGGQYVTETKDKDYTLSPRISGDGRFVAYLSLGQKALKGLSDWETKVKEEAPEIKQSGASIEFRRPDLPYELRILDTDSNKQIDLSSLKGFDATISSSLDILSWAENKNILPFWSLGGYSFVYENPEGKFELKNLDKDFFSEKPFSHMSVNSEFDGPAAADISPNGNYLLSLYQFVNPPQSCFNTWGYKTSFIDLVAKKLTKALLNKDLVCDVENVGWSGGESFILEYHPNHEFQFSKFVTPNEFPQKVLGYTGKVSHESISPNGKWLTYLIENIDSGVQEYVFFNIEKGDGLNLLGFVDEDNGGIKYDTVFTAKWNRNSKNAYVKMSADEGKTENIIMFNPESQTKKIIIKNASEFDIN